MELATDNNLSGTVPAEVLDLTLVLMSNHIKADHPFWEEMEKNGFDVVEFDPQNTSNLISEDSVLVIHDTENLVSGKFLESVINSHDALNAIPRVLLVDSEDDFRNIKKDIFKCDSVFEVDLENDTVIAEIAKKIRDITVESERKSRDNESWEDVSKALLNNVCENKSRRDLIQEIVSLSPLIKEYDYTVKSLLKLIADSFDASAVTLFTEFDRTLYTLVHKSSTKNYIRDMQNTLKVMQEESDSRDFIEVIWGRRLLKKRLENGNENSNFLVIPLQVKEQLLGYISIPNTRSESENDYYIRLLANQIALIINTSVQYKHEHKLVQNNFLRLGAINEVCRLFADLDSKDFGLQFLLILLEHISADKGILSLMDEKGKITNMHSIGFDQETQEWLKYDENTLPWEETFKGDEPNSGVVNIPLRDDKEKTSQLYYVGYPLFDVQGKLGVLFILFKTPPKDQDSFLPFYQTMATLASTHFANIGLYEQYLEKRLMEEQINIARDIQCELLPKHTPELDDFYLAASSRSATQVGGDFYDFVDTPDGKLVIVIGDVSGKGIPASQLMSMTKSLLKFRLQQGTPLHIAMKDVNNYLTTETPAEKFVTSQAILVDEQNKTMEIVNAGHGSLMIYRGNKEEFDEVDAEGLALGILTDVDFMTKKTSYSPGDIIIMFTDGLHEAMSPTREQFGTDRVKEIIREMANSRASKILARFYKAITKHAAGMPQHDDTTIIVMKARQA